MLEILGCVALIPGFGATMDRALGVQPYGGIGIGLAGLVLVVTAERASGTGGRASGRSEPPSADRERG